MLNKLFTWQRDRQQSGYDKLLLCGAYWPIKFDMYLLKFPQGSQITPHTDKVESGRHYRLNIVLKTAQQGGEFICATPIYTSKRIKLFRPDLCEHSVTEVTFGTRYVLSIGWVRN